MGNKNSKGAKTNDQSSRNDTPNTLVPKTTPSASSFPSPSPPKALPSGKPGPPRGPLPSPETLIALADGLTKAIKRFVPACYKLQQNIPRSKRLHKTDLQKRRKNILNLLHRANPYGLKQTLDTCISVAMDIDFMREVTNSQGTVNVFPLLKDAEKRVNIIHSCMKALVQEEDSVDKEWTRLLNTAGIGEEYSKDVTRLRADLQRQLQGLLEYWNPEFSRISGLKIDMSISDFRGYTEQWALAQKALRETNSAITLARDSFFEE